MSAHLIALDPRSVVQQARHVVDASHPSEDAPLNDAERRQQELVKKKRDSLHEDVRKVRRVIRTFGNTRFGDSTVRHERWWSKELHSEYHSIHYFEHMRTWKYPSYFDLFFRSQVMYESLIHTIMSPCNVTLSPNFDSSKSLLFSEKCNSI